MRLIVCEKDIAAARISQILSDGKSKTVQTSGVNTYSWDDVRVVGLKGHVISVDFPEGYADWQKTDFQKLIDVKLVEVPSQANIIKNVQKAAEGAEELVIACDYDSEGEAIGLEAINIVKEINPKIKIKRAIFSAITESDIKKSFSSLREVDYNLAYSAVARRDIDLIWGSVLTRFISVISGRMGQSFLSAGRVQTPTLALIVDKEKERLAFKSEIFWEITAALKKDSEKFLAQHKDVKTREAAEKLVLLKGPAKVISVTEQLKEKEPPTPFNTTDYLREASRIGLTALQAMMVAESLYMNGYISYPRTDNTVYPESTEFRDILEKLSKNKELGKHALELLKKKDLKPTRGKKKSEDHPPIHPTDNVEKEKLKTIEWKIYELICRRFFATLSENSKEYNVDIEFDISKEKFYSKGIKILEPGWREYYPYSKLKENILPKLKKEDVAEVLEIKSEEKQTNPPNRYGHGSIIKKMDDLRLGTKSTRPMILQKLALRGYVSKGKILIPSSTAFKVTDVLQKYADLVTKPDMTAKLEGDMEKIAAGNVKKENVIGESRKALTLIIDVMSKNKDKIRDEIRSAFENNLGTCPACKKGYMRVIISKKTKKRFAGCSNYPECKNGWPLPQKAKLRLLEEQCKLCGIRRIIVEGRRAFEICPNINCPGRKQIEIIEEPES
jgi:DNA topoisomerase-1